MEMKDFFSKRIPVRYASKNYQEVVANKS